MEKGDNNRADIESWSHVGGEGRKGSVGQEGRFTRSDGVVFELSYVVGFLDIQYFFV